jgi:hypothetical protein
MRRRSVCTAARGQTRTEHLKLVAQYLGWRSAGQPESKDLNKFLLERAMEHDSPTLLFRLACEYLISAGVRRTCTRRTGTCCVH